MLAIIAEDIDYPRLDEEFEHFIDDEEGISVIARCMLTLHEWRLMS